ncbi:MAG: hypothetical protein J0I12_07580 [Candidatus Eremiobacteraeota bacterium]|nr:hypothetical protein [Candidatus Eremiobacteraeota bacterium]
MDLVAASRCLTLLAMAWALWLSRRAWTGPRLAPRTPVFPGAPSVEALFPALFGLLALSLVGSWAVAPLVVLLGLFCASDWTRFRPWLYQNVCLILSLTYLPPAQALLACQLVTVSIYFWAGLMKVNRLFVEVVMPYITGPLCKNRFPGRVSYAIPFVEAALGLGLLFPVTRGISILGALGMHAFILLCFSRWGHKTHREIWPWNAAMALNNVLLFGFSSSSALDILWGSHLWHRLLLLLFAVLPVLGFWNRLDPVFSHGHMAGRHCFGALFLTRRLQRRLPERLRGLCHSQGRYFMLDISQWWMEELRVPPPQQESMLVAIARDFRRYEPTEGDLRLLVFRMPGALCSANPQKEYTWGELFLTD